MRLSRQLSILGGGSVPSSPQVKKACRLVVLGSTQTGKTCIVNRFLNGTYDDSYLPTIENFHRKLYKIHSEFYQLDILDTSGNDPFPAARRLSLLTGRLKKLSTLFSTKFYFCFSAGNLRGTRTSSRLITKLA